MNLFSHSLRTTSSIYAAVIATALLSTSPVFAHIRHHHNEVAAHRSHAERRSREARGIREARRHRNRPDAAPAEQVETPDDMAPYLAGTYPHPLSRYTVLMDVNSGKVLFGENGDVRREPASLTKIMAATVLLENGKLNDTVVAPQDVTGVPESSLHLRVGEKISLEDLLYAMLLRSANDTPIAGASYLSGSIPRFVGLMNQKAVDEGCTNTHFVTPNGLYDPNHYSTAHDLATMARYAVLHLPMFDEIVKTQRYKVHRSIDKSDTLVTNTAASYLKYFPGADGIKTGFISEAGHCFVGSATRGGWRLIAVSLDSGKCREDVEGMLSYGFAHFAPVVAVPQGTSEESIALPNIDTSVTVQTGADLDDVISKDHPATLPPNYTTSVAPLPADKIELPIKVGDVVGQVTLYSNGKKITTGDAVATMPVAAPANLALGPSLTASLASAGKLLSNTVVRIAIVAFLALNGLKYYAGTLAKNSRRRRSRLSAQMRAVD